MPVSLKALIGKLNRETKATLEQSAGLCLSRTHYYIEIEHYLSKLLEATDNDFQRIIRHYGVDSSKLNSDLMKGLDRIKSGNAKSPAWSQQLAKMLREAWSI